MCSFRRTSNARRDRRTGKAGFRTTVTEAERHAIVVDLAAVADLIDQARIAVAPDRRDYVTARTMLEKVLRQSPRLQAIVGELAKAEQ